MATDVGSGAFISLWGERGRWLVLVASAGSILVGLPLMFTPPLALVLDISLSLPHLWLVYRFWRQPGRWDIAVAVTVGLLFLVLAGAALLGALTGKPPLWEIALRVALVLCQPTIVVGAILAERSLPVVPSPARPADPRWLALACVSAVVATLFAALYLNMETRRLAQVLWSLPFLLPYFIILLSLRKEPRKLGLGLAVGLGCLGAIGGSVHLLTSLGWRGGFLQLGFWVMLALSHGLMAVAALCARPVEATPVPETAAGEQPLRSGWWWTTRTMIWFSLVVLAITLLLSFLDLADRGARVPGGWWWTLGMITAPYVVILVLFAREQPRAGLAMAAGWGAMAAILWLSIAPMGFHTRYATSSGFVSVFGPLLALGQVLLVVSAGVAYSRLRRAAGKSGQVVASLLAPVMLGLVAFVWLTSPVGERSVPRTLSGGRNESSAVGSVRTIVTAQFTYAATYPERGFAPTLATLGPPPRGEPTSPEAVDFIDMNLAAGERAGYRFILVPAPPDESGKINAFVVHARPLEFERTGVRSFRSDESGIIRFTVEDRLAHEDDPPLH